MHLLIHCYLLVDGMPSHPSPVVLVNLMLEEGITISLRTLQKTAMGFMHALC